MTGKTVQIWVGNQSSMAAEVEDVSYITVDGYEINPELLDFIKEDSWYGPAWFKKGPQSAGYILCTTIDPNNQGEAKAAP